MNDKPLYWDSEKQKLYWVDTLYLGYDEKTEIHNVETSRHYLEFKVVDENKVAYPSPIIKIKEEEG